MYRFNIFGGHFQPLGGPNLARWSPLEYLWCTCICSKVVDNVLNLAALEPYKALALWALLSFFFDLALISCGLDDSV